MWRAIGAPSFYRWTQDGAEMWMDDGRGWETAGAHWERHEFDCSAFERVEGTNSEPQTAAVREPLKVGDKVLILRGATSFCVRFEDVGAVAEVIKIDDTGFYARTEFTAPHGWALFAEDEGKTWERVE